jgi:DNA replication protein DnaC
LKSDFKKILDGLTVMSEDQVKQQEKEELERINKENERIERLKKEYLTKKIPPRYSNIEEPMHSDVVNAYCSIMYGGFGTGKTWEAYSIARKLYLEGIVNNFELVTEIGLLNELKAGFNDGSFNERVSKYKNIDLLIVDEIGKSNDTDFNKSLLFEILNHRYDWLKKTILICNAKEKKELFDLMPTATIDRFRECIVFMDGKSRRYL